ncbi:MAG: DUF1800 family protein, partial [Burkholderiaceae bacterium]
GKLLRKLDFDISRFLEKLFLSRHFYASRNIGSRIKGPVELVISTYRHLGLDAVPGVPDFNVVTQALGQRLMHPPTVAGWSHGRSWITPSLLFERSNFALDVLFPDIGFVPFDRFPNYPNAEIVNVQDRLRQGMSISQATKPTGVDSGMMSASSLTADRNEDFNTRLGTMRGWQMALERVKPIDRHTPRLDLSRQVIDAGLTTPRSVVEHFAQEFFVVLPRTRDIAEITRFLSVELGTDDVQSATSYLEEPLRKMLHRLLSLPEYQLS